jgi:hypothetical protein
MFEGARRIAAIFKALAVCAAIVLSFAISLEDNEITLSYETAGPGMPFVKMADGSCDRLDGSYDESIYDYNLGGSYSAWVTLCFLAKKTNDERILIPYKSFEDGSWQGDIPYSDHISSYIRNRKDTFRLSEDDRVAARQEAQRKRLRAIGWGVIYAIASSLAIWLILSTVQRLIGWVARGFLGIPRGVD